MPGPVLVAFGGLPGTGKTTIARAVAEGCEALYVRIDTIEQAIRAAGVLAGAVGPAGYLVAYGVAEANLKLGRTVVADSVNPIPVTREAWRGVAARSGARLVEVEVVCSDAAEHRRRVETRVVDVPGLRPPTWAEVMGRDYAAWSEPHLIVDTTTVAPADAARLVCRAVAEAS